MRAARVLAQAKINLFLRVGPRDESGYHELWTHFHRIDLADEVIVHVDGGIRGRSLDVGGPRMPVGGLGPPQKNLAYRAAIEYAARSRDQFPRSFAIEVTKNIPVGGGLGGGSADAGAVLRALDAIAPRPMEPEAFLGAATSLGADVPFLAADIHTAIATGRGEVFTPFTDRNPPATVILLVPPFSVATADAYQWLDDDRSGAPPAAMVRSEWTALARTDSPWTNEIGNDFEPVVEKRHPQLKAMRDRLIELGARTARLAGSGSCVFGIFDKTVPDPRDVEVDALVLVTRTSTRVVQVEVLK
jgi:4-diphosphocytidyl-2-C-methyl-D-erythritol kinase